MRALRTKTVIGLGFGTVLLLMSVLTLIGLQVLDASNRRLERVVHTNNTKTDLIVAMRTAARERTVSLNKMLVLQDPFAVDEEWMRFIHLAGAFTEARRALMELPLTHAERVLLQRQNELTRQVAPLQDEVARLILDGRRDLAGSLLLEKAFPGQDRTFAVLSDLLQLQKDAANAAVREARADYRAALLAMVAAAGAVALLSLLIAVFVIRRTSEIERRLLAEKERAQVTLHSIGDGVITTDAVGRIERLNAAAEALTGWDSRQARGKPLLQVLRMVRESDRKLIPDPVSKALRGGRVYNSASDVLLSRRDGKEFAIEFSAAPIVDRWHHRTAGTILVFRDVTATRALAKQLAHQARHDSLTGLINRREFEARLQEILAQVHRYPAQHHWLCYIDLDQFKLINDTCGHLAGDELLKQISGHLRREVRETDLVARMGGDEFAILLRNCETEGAHEIVERIRLVLHEQRFAWENRIFTSSASIGMVPINAASGSPYDLLSAADKACYIAKDQGRNRVHVYLPDDDAVARHEGEMEWVHRIRKALEEDRFVLYYQSIQALRAGGDHCEVLLRMQNEGGDTVPPMAFIPAAERYNLMVDLDRWVVRTTFETLRAPLSCRTGSDAFVSINLSAQSLCDEEFLPFVLEQLRSRGIPGRRICFEITETAAIANLSRAQEFIRTLKQEGCRFALDDFGSGLSSFGYLKTLPVNFLKIDGSFVRDIIGDPMDRALVDSINQIGHVLGIATIAEYVENDSTLALLREMGVDYAQGYGIARPRPIEHLVATLGGGDSAGILNAG